MELKLFVISVIFHHFVFSPKSRLPPPTLKFLNNIFAVEILGALNRGPCTCSTIKVFKLTNLHVLRLQIYITIAQVCLVCAHTQVHAWSVLCMCTYHRVIFIYIQKLQFSGTYCHKTGTRPPSCQTPRQPTIYKHTNVPLSSENTWTPFHHPQNFSEKFYSALLTIVSHV